jgi:hypothetical protein
MKKNRKYFIPLSVWLLLMACGNRQKLPAQVISMPGSKPGDTAHVRMDGGYQLKYVKDSFSRYGEEGPYLYGAIFFFDNGAVHYAGSSSTLDNLKAWHQKYDTKDTRLNWGVYQMASDTLKVIIFKPYPGGLLGGQKLYASHYTGIVKNRDSILQWHLTPPYPAVNLKAGENQYLIEKEKKPVNLYFKSVPVETIMNPHKTWMDKHQAG